MIFHDSQAMLYAGVNQSIFCHIKGYKVRGHTKKLKFYQSMVTVVRSLSTEPKGPRFDAASEVRLPRLFLPHTTLMWEPLAWICLFFCPWSSNKLGVLNFTNFKQFLAHAHC